MSETSGGAHKKAALSQTSKKSWAWLLNIMALLSGRVVTTLDPKGIGA